MSLKDLLVEIESLQNMLVDIATGGSGNDEDYKSLRNHLLSISELKNLLPQLLQTNRTAGQFWQFIKYKLPSYAERRKYIWDEFTPLLTYVESKKQGVAERTISHKIDKVNQEFINAEWLKALERNTIVKTKHFRRLESMN